MIRLRTPLDYLYPFPFAQVSQYLYDTFSQLVVDDLPSILRGEYDMVFAHPFRVCAFRRKSDFFGMEITPCFLAA